MNSGDRIFNVPQPAGGKANESAGKNQKERLRAFLFVRLRRNARASVVSKLGCAFASHAGRACGESGISAAR